MPDKHWGKVCQGEWAFPWVHEVKDSKEKFFRGWSRLIRGTDFEGLGFHGLRHSFNSVALSKRTPVKVLGQWVGHLDRNTTARAYGHFIPTDSTVLTGSLQLFKAK